VIAQQTAINLSLYFRDKEGNPIIPREYVPSSLSEDYSLKRDVTLPITEHPEIKKLSNYENIAKIRYQLASNNFLPELNLIAYTSKQNGTGGYPLLIPQAAMVGISLKFPLMQRDAKGNLIQAQSELHQVRIEKKFLYEKLHNELLKMLTGINQWTKQVVLLKKELSLAKTVQEAEIKKFNHGDSTLFLVNQREQATGQIELNTLHAQVELEILKAKVRFFSSTEIDLTGSSILNIKTPVIAQ
jgi:outer membrane protein TolC